MNYTTWTCVVSLFLLLSVLAEASAQESGSTPTPILERLEDALEREESLSRETREALLELPQGLQEDATATGADGVPTRSDENEIARIVDEQLAAKGVTPDSERAAWQEVFENLALYGDVRLRYEGDFLLDTRPDRHRARIRLRLGVNYRLLEEVLVGARMVTGDRVDPRSSHVTLGDGFDELEIGLDRAFVTYQPSWFRGASLTGGKFNHSFYRNPVYGELVWDADVQPEGVLGSYSRFRVGPFESLKFFAGEYVLLEQSTADEALSTVVQASAVFRPIDSLRADCAVGYYFYTDATPDGSTTIPADNVGNSTVDNNGDGLADDFGADFGILNPIVAFTWDSGSIPLTASGEYILNTEGGQKNQGWAIGVAGGRARQPGDWRAYYQWQVVEQDAVFSAFAQDDFLFTTNHRSHLFGVSYRILDKIGLHLWLLISRLDRALPPSTLDSKQDQWRIRFDVDVRF